MIHKTKRKSEDSNFYSRPQSKTKNLVPTVTLIHSYGCSSLVQYAKTASDFRAIISFFASLDEISPAYDKKESLK